MMILIDEKNLTTVENICQHDPVRPNIPCDWRIANGNKVFYKGIESFDMNNIEEWSAACCVAFKNVVPKSEMGIGVLYSLWKHRNLLYSMVYKKRRRKRDHLQHCGLSQRT